MRSNSCPLAEGELQNISVLITVISAHHTTSQFWTGHYIWRQPCHGQGRELLLPIQGTHSAKEAEERSGSLPHWASLRRLFPHFSSIFLTLPLPPIRSWTRISPVAGCSCCGHSEAVSVCVSPLVRSHVSPSLSSLQCGWQICASGEDWLCCTGPPLSQRCKHLMYWFIPTLCLPDPPSLQYKLLLYVTQSNHVTSAKIEPSFVFTVSPSS